MIHDADLKFASAAAGTSVLSLAGVSIYVPLPSLAAITWADYQVVMDKGAGRPLIGRFEVIEALTSADATLKFGLAVCVSNQTDGSAAYPLAVSTPTLISAWVAGAFTEVLLPKLPTVLQAAPGPYRYVFLALYVEVTAIAFGVALFTGGTFNAFLTMDTDTEPTRYSSGFTV